MVPLMEMRRQLDRGTRTISLSHLRCFLYLHLDALTSNTDPPLFQPTLLLDLHLPCPAHQPPKPYTSSPQPREPRIPPQSPPGTRHPSPPRHPIPLPAEPTVQGIRFPRSPSTDSWRRARGRSARGGGCFRARGGRWVGTLERGEGGVVLERRWLGE